jgi:cell division protein FtsQ
VSDARFLLPAVPAGEEQSASFRIQGIRYASRDRILATFRPDSGRSVIQLPLKQRRNQLLEPGGVTWLEDASVSRLWPNSIMVRVRERSPVAFVSLPRRQLLVDAHGVLLESPPNAKFSLPVLHGITEAGTNEKRAASIAPALRLLAGIGSAASQVSEINVALPDNLRITVLKGDRAVELWLGERNLAQRFQVFERTYEKMREHAPRAPIFDMRIDGQAWTREE